LQVVLLVVLLRQGAKLGGHETGELLRCQVRIDRLVLGVLFGEEAKVGRQRLLGHVRVDDAPGVLVAEGILGDGRCVVEYLREGAVGAHLEGGWRGWSRLWLMIMAG